jgi:lysine-N-methylase
MILRTPDYYEKFRCLAAACPRNCCVGWEIAVDDATAAWFETVPGPFGQRLRAGLTRDGDGQRCFAQKDGRCPFLNAENLCEVHLRLGSEHTGAVCRTHPRFTEDYGALRETSLAASCPAACRLLLGSSAPLTFPAVSTAEAAAPWTDPMLGAYLDCRERAFAILGRRELPMDERLTWLLVFANDAQALVDDGRGDELPELCGEETEAPELSLPAGAPLFPHAFAVLGGLEHLEADWPALLRSAAAAPPAVLPPWQEERAACYFLFRWFLKAVTDGDLLSRAELAVFAVLCWRRLAACTDPADALSRFCREIEHSEENLAALQQAFCRDPELGLAPFFRTLQPQVNV